MCVVKKYAGAVQPDEEMKRYWFFAPNAQTNDMDN